MRNIKGMGFMLLVWGPMAQASLNAAPVSAALLQPLSAACNLLVAQHADWGNINAMVRSARVCLQRPAEQQQSDRMPEQADAGLVQCNSSLLPDLTQGK
ncbi:hypothetical protein I1A46_01660 [Serratia liquefaciens]|uniref:hypothetical protein n=1 Tax=Serratia liquefaciens TaxID=614 RepID=UPI00102160DE|nr:hypothetical protein [Serratia liquefaciens]EJB8515829.1 hypothetical protein [Pseudomonas aeruginosa]MBF8103832.1 hypothetical protein [Serratia liquefaciens]MBH2809239.1 hypothetical protein [Serratia liquefaciens]MDU4174971.1 hypothetical protein [Serratia liquefaciens]RYM70851.1 hypothetical protein BSQ99_12790 [Serratia liquefaciens]